MTGMTEGVGDGLAILVHVYLLIISIGDLILFLRLKNITSS